MAVTDEFRVLIATDGSVAAQAALETAMRFPWPEPSIARAIIASGGYDWVERGSRFQPALDHAFHLEAQSAKRLLSKRWKDCDVVIRDAAPADAIQQEMRHFRADVLALGWRGHGTFKRLLMGSVSRELAAQATCPVLVARSAPRSVRRILLGYDDSPNAKRALRLLQSATPPAKNVLVLATVVELLAVPIVSRLPSSLRAAIRAGAEHENHERLERARKKIESIAQRLGARGWNVRTRLLRGTPLDCLLSEAQRQRADLIMLGARAKTGVQRALLGSVAAGALNGSNIPVLIVR
jgi:nucleotide-binding universal stress UspA family protein